MLDPDMELFAGEARRIVSEGRARGEELFQDPDNGFPVALPEGDKVGMDPYFAAKANEAERSGFSRRPPRR